MIKLSFCIPVYNQIHLVQQCIQSIISYQGSDIEIIISDDCSTENIIGLVQELNDGRIYYYKNSENLGHDKNILASFEHAKGKFVFLLRTRDKMIASSIPLIIQAISTYPNASYITGSALDEKGHERIAYKNDKIFKKGKDALQTNNILYIHPSGSAYRRDLIDFNKIKRFLEVQVNSKFGFIVHNLLRLDLSQKGDFLILKNYIWIYTSTTHAKDIAVNSLGNNKSVYNSELCIKRFTNEVHWCNLVLPNELKVYEYEELFRCYLNQCTWGNKLYNSDKRMQKHYNYVSEKINISQERKHFIQCAQEIQETIFDEKIRNEINEKLERVIKENCTIGFLKYLVLKTSELFGVGDLLLYLNMKLRHMRRFE